MLKFLVKMNIFNSLVNGLLSLIFHFPLNNMSLETHGTHRAMSPELSPALRPGIAVTDNYY